MLKSNTSGREISQDEKLYLQNVTSLRISNYSDVKLNVTMDDITETIPPFNPSSGFPGFFEIASDNTKSDITISLEFDKTIKPVKTGKAVLRYKKIIINQEC